MLPPYDVKKYPAYLKGLVNDLGRLRGDIARLKAMRDEVDKRLAQCITEAEACERLIVRYDARLDPAGVTAVRAWRGKYGERGALKAAILEELKAAFPADLSTDLLSRVIQLRFELDFASTTARATWLHNSLGKALKKMVTEGLVERLHPADDRSGDFGRWVWIDPNRAAGSAAGMATLAAAAGVEVDDEAADQGSARDYAPSVGGEVPSANHFI